jgi:hypothetical protein
MEMRQAMVGLAEYVGWSQTTKVSDGEWVLLTFVIYLRLPRENGEGVPAQ